MAARDILDTAWGCIPHFQCRSIAVAIEYYTTALHFSFGGTHADSRDANAGPSMCSVFAGSGIRGANIYLFEVPRNAEIKPTRIMIALGTDAVDQYYALLMSEHKLKIVEPIADRPWGYRQFTVQDPDGNEIQFFRFLEGGNPGTTTIGHD